MKITKKELRVIMSSFNSISNRLMQAAYDDYLDVLKRFFAYIEENALLMEYINSCGGFDPQLEDAVNEVIKNYNTVFKFSLDEEKEVSEVYSVIKIVSKKEKIPPGLIMNYCSSSRSFADKLKEFNHRVVMILINHIDDYLKKVGIEMGMDENVVYNINGQQVNIANDSATITATQNNYGIDAGQLKDLISSMREAISPELSSEDTQDINECIDVIEGELSSAQPNEERVKDKFKILSRIDAGAKFASACCSLLTFADKVHPFLEQIIPWFQSL